MSAFGMSRRGVEEFVRESFFDNPPNGPAGPHARDDTRPTHPDSPTPGPTHSQFTHGCQGFPCPSSSTIELYTVRKMVPSFRFQWPRRPGLSSFDASAGTRPAQARVRPGSVRLAGGRLGLFLASTLLWQQQHQSGGRGLHLPTALPCFLSWGVCVCF